MTIEIDQTLHGYKNGHQLLASSKDLTPEEKRVLLIQSDLSGSNVYGGFDSYITGYPITESNLYCFSKTWYANEMPRPGCVWTHTLLIKFQDLGKIPELQSLLPLFERPTQEKYRSYEKGCTLTLEYDYYDQTINLDNAVVESLYRYPEQGIIIPAESNDLAEYESIITSIWSDQWPRLRRNFYFCSWALSLKTIGERVFDLQIIPDRNRLQIERQSGQVIVIDPKSKVTFFWEDLQRFRKSDIRKFLWTFGSDIPGERNFYIPLLQAFIVTRQNDLDVSKLASLIRTNFPEKDYARLMKGKIFGRNSMISQKVGEEEMIGFLASDDIEFLALDDLDLNKRFLDLIIERKVDSKKLLYIWSNAQHGRLSDDILRELYVDVSDLVQLLESDIKWLDMLDVRLEKLVTDSLLWKQSSYQLQKSILAWLSKSTLKVDWRACTYAILDSNSRIILELRKIIGRDSIYYSLDWLVRPNNKWSLLDDWARMITIGDELFLREWVRSNKGKINLKVFKLIFSFYDPLKLHNLDISGPIWAKAYSDLKPTESESKIIYVSCALLALGLNNRLSGSQNLVAETFSDVYRFAANSKIDYSTWKWIPKEDYEEDDLFFDVFSYFGFDSKKTKGNVPSWDYCEMLVRTLVNKFIKYSWSNQSFCDSIQDKEIFVRAVDYCLGFKKGKKFISKLSRDSEIKKVKLKAFQKSILARV